MLAVRVDTVRRLERESDSTAQLMLDAGRRAADFIADFRDQHSFLRDKRTVILCGRGNNGGDGLVAARFLVEKHHIEQVQVFSLLSLDQLRGDCFTHGQKLSKTVPFRQVHSPQEVDLSDCLIVDALLGTGVCDELKAPFPAWIDAINQSGSLVVSLDVPSGIDADSGTANKAVQADMTVTFGLPKHGLFFEDGAKKCGRLEYASIGLNLDLVQAGEAEFECFTSADARKMLERLPVDTYKNLRGQIAILAGSRGYPNAPILNTEGALALGCGMIKLALQVRPDAFLAPQIISRKFADYGDDFNDRQRDNLAKFTADSQVILCGSGWGDGIDLAEVLKWVISQKKLMVLDADALNLLARNPALAEHWSSAVLTPHLGEARRLCRAFGIDETGHASQMAQSLALALNAIIVLKGAQSWIAAPDGRLTVVASGTPALAKAGSGDVLAGVIATALAQYKDSFEAAAFGGFIHGMGASVSGQRAFRIDALGYKIGDYLSKISPFA